MIRPDEDAQLQVTSLDIPLPDLPKFPEIQTPSFSIIEDFSLPDFFSRPNYYIHSTPNAKPYSSYTLTSSDTEYYDEELPDIPFAIFEKTIEKWEKLTQNDPALSKKQALDLCNFSSTEGIEAVYSYWISKRKKNKMPLVRMFWKSAERSDENLSKVFCRRKGDKMKLRSIKGREHENKLKALKLFSNIHEIKEILIWVVRRECLKLNITRLKMMEFNYKRAEILEMRYVDKDYQEVLREPIVENSSRFRNPVSYLNIFQREHPKSNLKV